MLPQATHAPTGQRRTVHLLQETSRALVLPAQLPPTGGARDLRAQQQVLAVAPAGTGKSVAQEACQAVRRARPQHHARPLGAVPHLLRGSLRGPRLPERATGGPNEGRGAPRPAGTQGARACSTSLHAGLPGSRALRAPRGASPVRGRRRPQGDTGDPDYAGPISHAQARRAAGAPVMRPRKALQLVGLQPPAQPALLRRPQVHLGAI